MKGSVDAGGSGQGPPAETRLESGSQRRDCRPVEHQQESCTLESWLARWLARARCGPGSPLRACFLSLEKHPPHFCR